MTAGKFPKFARIRTLNPELDRLQDNIAAVLDSLAHSVQITPIGGAPPPAWIRFDILPGWADLDAGNELSHYHIDALNYVHIEAAFKNVSGGALATTVATLPKGFRPAGTIDVPVSTGAGAVNGVTINENGNITPDAAIPNGSHFHICVVYLAEE